MGHADGPGLRRVSSCGAMRVPFLGSFKDPSHVPQPQGPGWPEKECSNRFTTQAYFPDRQRADRQESGRRRHVRRGRTVQRFLGALPKTPPLPRTSIVRAAYSYVGHEPKPGRVGPVSSLSFLHRLHAGAAGLAVFGERCFRAAAFRALGRGKKSRGFRCPVRRGTPPRGGGMPGDGERANGLKERRNGLLRREGR